MNTQHLIPYLNDHLAGSEAALELAQHLQSSDPDTPSGAYLSTFLSELEQDRAVLKMLIARLGGVNPVKTAVGWLGEKAARLKLSATASQPAFARLEQLEVLVLGVRGKLALWDALAATVATEGLFHDVDFGVLAERARAQLGALEAYRLEAAREAFL